MVTNLVDMATTEAAMFNVTMAPTVVGNVSYTLGPTRTILGVPIDIFSYIFLGIAGAAPILFLLTVMVSMKCYSWRRRKRLERLQNVSQIGMELWEAERTFHINGKFQHAYDGPALATLKESPTSMRSRSESMRLKASNSNPNVFFKGQEEANDSTVPTSMNPIANSTLSLPATVPSLNSEERQALECFDMIYEGLDSVSGAESLARSATFRFPHPLYDKTKNGLRLPSSSKISRRFSLKSFPNQLKVEVESHTLPARTSKRHPAHSGGLQAHPNASIAHTLSQMPQTLILPSPPVSVSDIASLPSPSQLNSPPVRSGTNDADIQLQVPGVTPSAVTQPSPAPSSPPLPPPPSTLPSLSPVPSMDYPSPVLPPKPPSPEPIYSISSKQSSKRSNNVSSSLSFRHNGSSSNLLDNVHNNTHNSLDSEGQSEVNNSDLDLQEQSVTAGTSDSGSKRSVELVPRKSWLHSAYSNPAFEEDTSDHL